MPSVDGIAYWFPKAPHNVSKVIAEAFAKGARACGASWYVSGAVENSPVDPEAQTAFYGILHGSGRVIEQAVKAGCDFHYIDHGYWGKSASLSTLDGNFRIVRNALQHSCVTKNKPLWRFDASGVVLEPAREWSTNYLVAIPPTHYQVQFYGRRIEEEFYRQLRRMGDNYENVHISVKGDKIPLTQHLEYASFALGFNSTGLFEAARRGIPVMTTGPSPLSELHDCLDPKEWEEKRLAVFRGCADRQFTLAEIADGTAYRTLKAIGELQERR